MTKNNVFLTFYNFRSDGITKSDNINCHFDSQLYRFRDKTKKSNNEEILDLKSNPVLGLKWHLSQPNG